jgi:hypothetical protein
VSSEPVPFFRSTRTEVMAVFWGGLDADEGEQVAVEVGPGDVEGVDVGGAEGW